MWWNGPCFLKSSNHSNAQNVDDYDSNINLFQEEVLCKEVLVAAIEENEAFNDDCESIKRNLNTGKNDEGLFRTFTRFNNANSPYDVKAPIVLCKSCELAHLTVFYIHSKLLYNCVKKNSY